MPPAAAAPDAGAQPEATTPGPAMAETAVPTADTTLVWQAPASWVSKPAAQFRKATFAVPGDAGESDLSITAFPGEAGGELANVNRWRSQLALPALAPEELENAVTRVEANGLKFTIVELAPRGDPAGKAMLGAMVPVGGSTWFFKLTGPGPSVKSAKPEFIGFLRTVRAP
jgi:nucleotide-binding universal stress UspA family protein